MSTNWEKISYPRLCALAGSKTSRLSQAMHNAGFRNLGLPFTYVAFNTSDTLKTIEAMRHFGWRGLSLTIPHKESAMTLVDEIQSDAKKIGAINTVINNGQKLTGYNTDYFGIEESFREKKIELKQKKVLVIGAGGASRAALSVLQNNQAEITITNRTLSKANTLAKEFAGQVLDFENLKKIGLSSFEIVINSSALGSIACDEAGYPFELESINHRAVVFDFVTNQTELSEFANKKRLQFIPGSRMLLHQAIKQFELFTEQKAPIAVMEKALVEEINRSV